MAAYTENEVLVLTRLARARGLINSLADPIAPLSQAREEGIQEVAKEIEALLEQVHQLIMVGDVS